MPASSSPALGMCFPRESPARVVREVAERPGNDGIDQLRVTEDCLHTAVPSLAATALAHTAEPADGVGPASVRRSLADAVAVIDAVVR